MTSQADFLVSYASALARLRVFAIPVQQRTTSGRVSEVSGVLPSLLSLLDLVYLGATAVHTRRLKQQRRAVSINFKPCPGCGNDSSRHAACSSQQVITISARLLCSSHARPAPLSNCVGAGPDNDAAEAHGVSGRHRRRHEGASGRCRRDCRVREATDWPKRRCNTMLRHLERW